MILLPIIALIIGIIAVPLLGIKPIAEPNMSIYLAVSCLAGLDTLCGGYRTGLEGKFRNDVFLTGFVSNTAIAFFLAWLGDKIGVNLYLVAALVLGQRVFVNLSFIRRIMLTKLQDERAKRKQLREKSTTTN